MVLGGNVGELSWVQSGGGHVKGVTAVTEIISFQLTKKGKGKALDWLLMTGPYDVSQETEDGRSDCLMQIL